MRIGIVLAVAATFTATSAKAQDERQAETEHLIIQWVEGVDTEAVEIAKSQGEAYYAQLVERLGHEPGRKIPVILGGNAEQPDGSWEYPRVDGWGRVHLFRYTPSNDSYFNAFAHELVHAFRIGRRAQADWFFEEAFAEFVALEVDPSLDGFPWYGTEVVVAAGQWYLDDESIPLAKLRERHRELNLPCRAQSYTLRASFFQYLGMTHGRDAVYAMAAESPAGTAEQYGTHFGAPLETLEVAWTAWLRKAYLAVEDHSAKAQAYRTQSPVQYFPVCTPGQGL